MNGTRVGLRESTRSITTLSGHGRKTVNTASNNIATKASSSGVLWGRRRGRKWSIQFLQGLETLGDGPFIAPWSRPQTWHGEAFVRLRAAATAQPNRRLAPRSASRYSLSTSFEHSVRPLF